MVRFLYSISVTRRALLLNARILKCIRKGVNKRVQLQNAAYSTDLWRYICLGYMIETHRFRQTLDDSYVLYMRGKDNGERGGGILLAIKSNIILKSSELLDHSTKRF